MFYPWFTGFPTGVENMGGGCAHPLNGGKGGSSKFKGGGRFKSIHGGSMVPLNAVKKYL